MKSSIASIAKATLVRLGEKKLHPTPANYAEVFEECAKEVGFSSSSQALIKKYIAMLDEIYQQELKNKRVRNLEELATFLIARINSQAAKKHKEIVELFRFIMDALLISRDKKVKDIAAMSLPKIIENMDLENIYLLKNKWREFKSSYDSEPLFKELESRGIKTNDFYSLMTAFLDNLELRSFEKQAKLLIQALKPSFGQNNSLDNFIKELEQNPKIIARRDFELRFFQALEKKNTAENIFVEKNLSFFSNNLSSIDEMLSSLFDKNDENIKLISTHKLDEKGDIKISFEFLNKRFKEINEQVARIKARVNATQDNDERQDWNLYKEIAKLDENFKDYKVNYALCVFKVLNSAFIMEKYGLNSFNVMSLKFKNTLRSFCEGADELWIIDESSFLTVLPGKDYAKAIVHLEKVLAEMDAYSFIYKDELVKFDIFSKALEKASNADTNILESLLDA